MLHYLPDSALCFTLSRIRFWYLHFCKCMCLWSRQTIFALYVYHLEFGFHISRFALHVMLYVAFRAFVMRMIVRDRATLCLQLSSGSS